MATKTYCRNDVEVQALSTNYKFIDRTNKRYGRLVVLGYAGMLRIGKKAHCMAYWWCECDCGSIIKACGCNLARGASTSCGCGRIEATKASNTKHGGRRNTDETEDLYSLWLNIKGRTTNPRNAEYKNYGGRGIALYANWVNDYAAFRDWINENLGERPDGYSLDRFGDEHGNDGNYEPGNLRWASPSQQMRNQRKTLMHNGMALADVYDELKPLVSYGVFSDRYKRHWCIDCCANVPLRGSCPHRTT
jgi:hypothetical protein